MENLHDAIILSRIQFALTLSFHILFPTLNIGLAGYIAGWEIAWLRTRDAVYYQLCRFWTKIFALAFGMGIVSGLVLSYEFGTNFSKFSAAAGNIVGPLMSYEVLTAFFLEAGFLGIMLFGWKRVSEKMHLACTLLVTTGALISTFWILSANSWMQTPQGYILRNGVFYVDDWWKIIFNPSFPYRLAHMVTASYLATTFFVAGVSAWYLLRGEQTIFARKAFSQALIVALILAPLQISIGDMHGLNTLHHQPLKIAAIEGRWETQQDAPLTLFAVPDMKNETNHFALEIPHLGSLILTHRLNGEITGLKSVAAQDRPYVPVPFYAFRVMVGIGLWLFILALAGFALRLKSTLATSRPFHKACLLSMPLGFVAVIAGWWVTETGRQPWVIYGLMRTRDAASALPPAEVGIMLALIAALYAFLLSSFIFYVCYLVKRGPELPPASTADKLTTWLEDKQ